MLTKEQEHVISLIEESKSLLLTGKAGTGKTHLVNIFKQDLNKKKVNHISVSFTASSAKLVGGETIHSFLITPKRLLPLAQEMTSELNKAKKIVKKNLEKHSEGMSSQSLNVYLNIISSLGSTEVFFIDEISMVSPELLHCFIQSIEFSRSIFFSKGFRSILGDYDLIKFSMLKEDSKKQMPTFVMTGDFFQIPPIMQSNLDLKRKRDRNRDDFAVLRFAASEYLHFLTNFRKSGCPSEDKNELEQKFNNFDKAVRDLIREDMDASFFTLPMLKQICSPYSGWTLKCLKQTRFVFDSFTDLVGPTYSEPQKKWPYKELRDRSMISEVELHQSQRQKGDADYIKILDMIRIGGFCVWNSTQAKFVHPEKLHEVPDVWPSHLKEKLRKRVDAPIPSNSVRIVLKNEEASNFNRKEMEKLENETLKVIQAQEFYIENKGAQHGELRVLLGNDDGLGESEKKLIANFKEEYPSECRDLQNFEFKLGAKVIVTRNIDKKNGIINGLTGTVVACKKQSIEILTENQNRVWIEMVEHLRPLSLNKFYCIKYLPAILGWAITSCRCQGMTLSYAEICLNMQYTCGHLYTAFSRLTSLESLSIKLPVSNSGNKLSIDFFMETQVFGCHPISYQKFGVANCNS